MVGVVGSSPIAPTNYGTDKNGYDTADYAGRFDSLAARCGFVLFTQKSAVDPRFFVFCR